MPQIQVLDQHTIDQIAAGEVVERPASVVKELVENAIDAKSTAITIEIKEGGKSLIRITDNGCGLEKDQVKTAFLSHATSKITSAEDLLTVSSLGFRGEALSSIASISKVELITKTREAFVGARYIIEGGKGKELEEVGAPDGTTFLVRDLFYNTPARQKFLKTATTEAGYISTLLERLALSHPNISFKFINNGQTKLQTSGNGNKRDIIYQIYGRDIAANLIEIDYKQEHFSIAGYIGKPIISRGNRNYENYYINHRYIKSNLIAKGIEEAYKAFMMQHQYPFTVLYFDIDPELVDVNVHPAKMEMRFRNGEALYQGIVVGLRNGLMHRELIPEVSVEEKKQTVQDRPNVVQSTPEPFEKNRKREFEAQKASMQTAAQPPKSVVADVLDKKQLHQMTLAETISYQDASQTGKTTENASGNGIQPVNKHSVETAEEGKITDTIQTVLQQSVSDSTKDGTTQPQINPKEPSGKTVESVEPRKETGSLRQATENRPLLAPESRKYHRIIGQYLDTYWLVEFDEKLFIIDQHAAHEKVLYERTMKTFDTREFTSQNLYPPIVVSLSMQEENLLQQYLPEFERIGFVIEHFGGRDYTISAVPDNLFGLDGKQLMLDMLDGLTDITGTETSDMIRHKVATMSCKAAVKGNNHLSYQEAETLIDELLTLENPYHCPHGRPTIISMTKGEIERKFKRIV